MRYWQFFFWMGAAFIYSISVVIPRPVEAALPKQTNVMTKNNDFFLVKIESGEDRIINIIGNIVTTKDVSRFCEGFYKSFTGFFPGNVSLDSIMAQDGEQADTKDGQGGVIDSWHVGDYIFFFLPVFAGLFVFYFILFLIQPVISSLMVLTTEIRC